MAEPRSREGCRGLHRRYDDHYDRRWDDLYDRYDRYGSSRYGARGLHLLRPRQRPDHRIQPLSIRSGGLRCARALGPCAFSRSKLVIPP